ncbi:DUF3000 domain-containing protein [Flexivirga caeni]|uniref:DUF3000 domain-containing protein n=1 Tax=Flexivirga caeni TaxID=2294115 RepID=A0A3M9LZI8_9MICO|nr:DUF3000 domain-containing protein [Flexivirga caeni]RNI18397.1 DUF3000 domain-containing protein [Flexivirga caeni]
MGTHDLGGAAAPDFQQAVRTLQTVRLRPEVRLTEVPAPGRIAPYSLAMTADVCSTVDDDEAELATGRFVVLHDPDFPEPWEGSWRVVTFARAELEAETGADPLLGQVGWSWLMDSLRDGGAHFRAEAGTVTRVLSEGFGSLAEDGGTVEIEIRASWTPTDPDLGTHLAAWTDLLSTVAGLPPLPDGVVALPGQRR